MSKEKIEQIRFCRNCGNELIENAQFCNKCGTQILREKRQIDKTKVLLWLLLFIVIILVTVICMLLSDKHSGVEGNVHVISSDTETIIEDSTSKITIISDYQFQYCEEESRYVLLFKLTNEGGEAISTNGIVEIRIENDNNETVHKSKTYFKEHNFDYWTDENNHEVFLAAIYLNSSTIQKGSTDTGMLYFEVYGNECDFDEMTIPVSELPVKSGKEESGTTIIESQTEKVGDEHGKQTASLQSTCLSMACYNKVGVGEQYCAEHKCNNAGCLFAREYNSMYCSSCSCSTIGCHNLKQSISSHCVEHACEAAGCLSEKAFGKRYCYLHTCGSCDNIKVDGGFYCVEHTCSKNWCTSNKAPSSDYCTFHGCYAAFCKNGAIDGGQYCDEHTCIENGCMYQKLSGYEYCFSHNP